MDDLEEWTNILRLIAYVIAIEGGDIPWVTNPRKIITTASLSFAANFWLAIVHAFLRPIVNGNTLHCSQASLATCLMSRYALNVGHMIAIEC